MSLTGEKGDKPKPEGVALLKEVMETSDLKIDKRIEFTPEETMQIWEVEQSFKELHVELTYLKHIINGLDQNGDPQVNGWVGTVNRMSRDNEEMQNQFQKLRHPNQNGRMEMDMEAIEGLNTKATESLVTVKALKQPAFETFLRHASSKMNRYSHEELTIFTSEFSTEIGSGGFSKVYKCLLADGITQGVVKVLVQKDDKEKDFLQDVFVIEVSTMIKASHPNLIKLYGFCFDANMQALVYEYMEMRSLDRVLFKKEIHAEWQKLYDIATNVAKVVAYLHEECGDHQIIHHDIKPGNVLIDSSLFPKLTDFGVSKIMSKDVSHLARTSLIGTSSYIAPEMKTQGSKVTCRCDVFSFGMLLFDIFGMRINSECEPFFPNKVWDKFHKGEVDEIMNDCHIHETDKVRATILCRIAFWCIQFTAEDRPSMKDVVNILENELLVPMSHTPFYVTEGESFSLQQSHDGTKYLKVSRSTSTSHHKRKLKNYKAYVKKWQRETFEKDFVDVMPRSKLKEFTYEEIMSFTSNLSTKVGNGFFYDVYKGVFTYGQQIAVKVMRKSLRSSDDVNVYEGMFMRELKILSTNSHPNIIEALGFCLDGNFNALVLEYMDECLDMILFGNRHRNMEWKHLYCIAIQTAKVISYLHNGCDDPVFHSDIRPSNILLDRYLSPKVSGLDRAFLSPKVSGLDQAFLSPKVTGLDQAFRVDQAFLFPKVTGLDQTLLTDKGSTSRGTMGYIPHQGYIPPEAITNLSEVKNKYDVFSFGVLLLEIFGRQRVASRDTYLAKVYWRKFEEGQVEELLKECGFREKNKQNAKILLAVAFWCIQFTPQNRPPMKIVVKMLEKEMEVIEPPNPFVAHEQYAVD